MSREVQPEAIDRINNSVRNAAKNGLHRLQVVTFPCTFCSDGGRRINIANSEWPSSLEGFAKKTYDFYEKELKPLGSKLSSEIYQLSRWHAGEAALILKW